MKHNRKKFRSNADHASFLLRKYERMQAHDDRGRSLSHLYDFASSLLFDPSSLRLSDVLRIASDFFSVWGYR